MAIGGTGGLHSHGTSTEVESNNIFMPVKWYEDEFVLHFWTRTPQQDADKMARREIGRDKL